MLSLLGKGALRMLARSGPRLSIVLFHHVMSEPDALLTSEPDKTRFAEQLRWLKSTFQILPFDQQSATVMANLKKQHRAHKLHADLMIAAVAIAGKHIVVTRNVKHFIGLLPQDQIQNWIDEPLFN